MTNKHRYPLNWPELARECKERAGWKCEHCGVAQFTLVESRKGSPYIVYLHAAHVHHDQQNANPELIALCISCHARYDYAHNQREKRIMLEKLKHRMALLLVNDYRCMMGG